VPNGWECLIGAFSTRQKYLKDTLIGPEQQMAAKNAPIESAWNLSVTGCLNSKQGVPTTETICQCVCVCVCICIRV